MKEDLVSIDMFLTIFGASIQEVIEMIKKTIAAFGVLLT